MNAALIALLEKGFAYQQQGDLVAAEKNYLKVLKRDGKNEFALNLMGVVCHRTARHEEAAEYLRRALQINANDPETYNNLGLAYSELRRFDDARDAFEHSLRLNPRQPVTQNNLGNAFASVDSHERAIPCFESALKLDRDYVDCMNNLSVSLAEGGRLDHALQVIERALKTDRNRSESWINKGEVLLQMTRYDAAKEAFDMAVGVDGSIVAMIGLSTALKQLGEEQAAVDVLEQVLAREPNNTEAHNHLGVLQEQLGDAGSAAEHFRLALRFTPNHASSFFQLSKLKDQRLTKEEIRKIEQLVGDPKTLDIFRSSLYFALAWDYDKRKDYDSSFRYFLKAQQIKARRSPYRASEGSEYLSACRSIFPLATPVEGVEQDDLPIPIFVVGMPRSGTTLTEQIIASHSEIAGAGELGFVNDLVKQAAEITGSPFPQLLNDLGNDDLHELRRAYLSRIVERFGASKYIVDKNPLNFNFIGFIATIFPEARILFCNRDPMANCVSIFKLPFDDDQSYSHDLAALGHYYRQHEKLMEFWMHCYPDKIHRVRYEETVERLEEQARRMLDFIGVNFEESVLSFFENKRIVMTPSASQVREPIYKDSVAAWRRYEKYLGPLVDSLADNAGANV